MPPLNWARFMLINIDRSLFDGEEIVAELEEKAAVHAGVANHHDGNSSNDSNEKIAVNHVE